LGQDVNGAGLGAVDVLGLAERRGCESDKTELKSESHCCDLESFHCRQSPAFFTPETSRFPDERSVVFRMRQNEIFTE
jgi:hypothetical protein